MSAVIWHDLECGSYSEDLALWRELADRLGSPILDIGAGTGRVALDLARLGHSVTALDADPTLVAELKRRARELPVQAVLADARTFELASRFALCLVPMQTIQLLGGPEGRAALLERAHRHLRPGGLLAVAISPELPTYVVSAGSPAPLPDVCERDGTMYFSQPTAIRAQDDGYVLERRRERVSPAGERTVAHDLIALDHLDTQTLESEGRACGFVPAARRTIPATADYSGSEVVMLRA